MLRNLLESTKEDCNDRNNLESESEFQVDSAFMKDIEQSDKAPELRALELSVYDQETLETTIIKKVDEAFELRRREDVKNQLSRRIDETLRNISSCQGRLKKYESLHRALQSTGKTGNKNVAARGNVSNCRKELSSLEARKSYLEGMQAKILAGEDIDLQDIVSMECNESGNVSQKEETEVEKKIRLGEMTPFGNTLGTYGHNRVCDGLSGFEKYLQDQEKLQQNFKKLPKKRRIILDHVSGDGSVSDTKDKAKKPKSEKNILKKRILNPKKRKKKEKLGTGISEEHRDQKRSPAKPLSERTALEDSEGSEYIPSDDEEESDSSTKATSAVKEKKKELEKPRRKRRPKAETSYPELWSTDDSDWEYSDDESRIRRRKNSKKEIDDGNIEDYHDRLKLWEQEKANKMQTEISDGDCDEETSSYHYLDDGFKVPQELWDKLYSYQKVGVQWFWELNQQCSGGLLGDEMGLGKTVQVIAFLAGLSVSQLRSRHGSFRGLGPSIIVCPTTVMHQWVREFHSWWPPLRVAILHESGSYSGKRDSLINSIYSKGGILVTSYTGIVQHKDTLVARNWHYVILDEGHRIRNPDAQVTLAVKQLRTPHRLILSGSPMQNNLKELWSLFDFIFPGKLGTLPVFTSQMAVPITQGGYANASQVQVATAYKCATVLRDTISPYLLRRMKADVNSHICLPAKSEQVLFCKLTEDQRVLYKSYIESGEVERILHGHLKIFMGLIALRKICNHPDLYSGGPKLLKWEKEENLPEEERYGYWKKAGKMLVVESLLKIWHKQGHRVLLFTQGLQMLCILENFVVQQGYKYLKLDGGTSISSRQPLINKFNQDSSYFVFLLTTRVGGLGVNLTGADRVVIYDPDWNPATDTQARERAWRIGQQKNVTVYRLITAGTIEEKMYHRQIFKQFLTNKVLKDPRQRRFFKTNDLFELFTLKETDTEGSTETAAIFAGTCSEVKVKSQKNGGSQKNKEKNLGSVNMKIRKVNTGRRKEKEKSVVFSKSKLEHMKKLAQMLSKKFASMPSGNVASSAVDKENTPASLNECAIKIEDVNEEDGNNSLTVVAVTDTENAEHIKVEEFDIKTEVLEDVLTIDDGNINVKQENDNIEIPCSPVVNDGSVVLSESVDKVQENQPAEDFGGSCNPVKLVKQRKSVISGGGDSHSHRKHHKRKSKHQHEHRKKKSRSKASLFEGEYVPFLVGQDEHQTDTNTEDAGNVQQAHDDYVLRKLFKRSGLQTAMRHDAIMEEGPPDYALVEGEAQKVAQEAVRALKESRQQCFRADAGVPTWTGQSGVIRISSVSRSKQRKESCSKTVETPSTSNTFDHGPKSKNSDAPMSSSELLSRIRQRNLLVGSPEPPANSETHNETEHAESSAVVDENVELLTDIRNFVSFGSVSLGRATTSEIINNFKDRLPPGSTPLFKYLLQEVCKFYRLPSGEGVWKLKPEFKYV